MGHFQLLFNTKTFIFWQNQGQFILITEYIDKSTYFCRWWCLAHGNPIRIHPLGAGVEKLKHKHLCKKFY